MELYSSLPCNFVIMLEFFDDIDDDATCKGTRFLLIRTLEKLENNSLERMERSTLQ